MPCCPSSSEACLPSACLPSACLLLAAASSGRESIALLETLRRLMAEQRARSGAAAGQANGGSALQLAGQEEEEEEDTLLVGRCACFQGCWVGGRCRWKEFTRHAPTCLAPSLSAPPNYLQVDPREAFVLPRKSVTEAARCFVQPPPPATGSGASTPARPIASAAATPSTRECGTALALPVICLMHPPALHYYLASGVAALCNCVCAALPYLQLPPRMAAARCVLERCPARRDCPTAPCRHRRSLLPSPPLRMPPACCRCWTASAKPAWVHSFPLSCWTSRSLSSWRMAAKRE